MAKNGTDLIADIDDGYAKVSNLLLEALSCMPLSGAEYRVLMFIIRRTYGWAKSGDRGSGKLDVMSANEVCDGTGLTKSYVQKCLAKLAHKKAIVAVKTSSDNTMAYGINPAIEEWGNGDKEWTLAKVIMRDAQDTGKYVNTGGYRQNSPIPVTQNQGEVYDYLVHTYRPNSPIPIDQIVLYPEPVSPCVARPDGVPTDSITDIYTDNDSNNIMSTSQNPKPTKQNRKEADEKLEVEIQALRDTFEAADLAQAEDFIELVRYHQTRKVVTKVKVKKTLEELASLRAEQGMTSEAFAHGIKASIENDVPNVNYAKKAARGYRPNTTSTPRRLNMSIPPSTAWPKKTEVI